MASAQGLFDGSSTAEALFRPVLLSLRLSRIVFDSPRTARDLDKPEELEPELDSCVELETLDVSM